MDEELKNEEAKEEEEKAEEATKEVKSEEPEAEETVEETDSEEPEAEETAGESVTEEPEAEDTAEETAVEEETEEKPLDKMTAPELKEVAKKIPGVTGVTAMKKADLLDLIKKHRGIADEEPEKDSDKKKINVKEIKKKIADLKAAKTAAREAENKKEVDILRRRINRLKKMTRKAQ